MRTVHLTLACAALLALAACDKPKPREAEQAAAAAREPPPAGAVTIPTGPAPIAAVTASMPRKDGVAGFYIDFVNEAKDPINKQPAIVAAGAPITFGGFAFDAVTKAPAKGLDLVVDGKVFGVPYGQPRPDVAAFYKTDALTNVGYTVTLPADAIPKGAHSVVLRVAANDGAAYQESVPITFTVQ